ncbi:FAD-dependent oxidoreductase [Curvibacter sp. APW13]|uniref:NAD(P)/FAD-dependent oxidoreductase n=1 Tax=Curvibacter sp. APW13 TaxID=3077236 RepID=UPI0028E09115|nr:FAD-dependent oxidoreductase [Curvibacter sp. APW13]MDT8990414.1 FAD-dependent oxidoreductase [Curvibacter sp. APW13]
MAPKVAIIGSGIAGLGAAHALRGHADITLLEAGPYFGGHTNTVDVRLPDVQGRSVTHGVDTGFLVFNERTYPNLIALLGELGVASTQSDMSFSVQATTGAAGKPLLWSGTDLNGLFAQRSNLWSPRFWGMLADLLRFNALTTRLAREGSDAQMSQTLGAFLDEQGFGQAFREWYFMPMMACIWSCPTRQMLEFPVATMVRFCHNHGLLQVTNRPQWWTVTGGARHYVQAITDSIGDKRLNAPVQGVRYDATANDARGGVWVQTTHGEELFDRVVLATHSDQALRLLHDATPDEQRVLGAIGYQPNVAVLHTDTSVMPAARAAWSAWNYERAQDEHTEDARVCLHYWINRLQPLPFAQDVIVSLNPVRDIDPAKVIRRIDYAHPVFDLAAMAAQQQVPALQGDRHRYFAGAWMGYGFHEDGLKAGMAAANALLHDLERARHAPDAPKPAAMSALEPAL